jgi:hypothetical protein
MGSPLRLAATTMRPSRSRMSSSDVVSASTAMISLATVMSADLHQTRKKRARVEKRISE